MLLLGFPTQAAGADGQGISVYIDGVPIPVESESASGAYCMDVSPQMVGNRVFAPLRAMSRYFDADIAWTNPTVKLSRDGTSVVITPGSATAELNGSFLTLDAAPYTDKGRTMAPLRFVAEAFGCKVDYRMGSVYIATPPLAIDGREVVSVQRLSYMTFSSAMEESATNICISKLYALLLDRAGEEIDEPQYYMEGLPNLDIQFSYLMVTAYSFMETPGTNGSVIRQFKTYQRIDALGGGEPLAVGIDYGPYIICDETNNTWYKFSGSHLGVADEIADEIFSLGEWERYY